jgi:hypothetical protein
MDPISIALVIAANVAFTAWRNGHPTKEQQESKARIKAKFAEIDAKYANR